MSGRRLTCTHKIDSAAHTGFWLTCAQKSVSVVHTEPSGDGVGPVNVIIFLAVQQTQKLLILVQLPVGWGGVITFMFLCTHRHSNLIIFLAVQQTLHHHHQHHHHQQQHLRAQLCFFFACTTESVFAYTTEAHHPLCLCHPSKKCVLKKESGDFPANQVRQIILRWQKGSLRRVFSPKTLTTSPSCVKGWRWSESWKEPETLVQTRNNRCGFPS